MADIAPYIVLMGDVCTGKSTILEKLTGEKGRNSAAGESFTKETSTFLVPDGSLIIGDTPGLNPSKGKFEHSVCVAAAMNFKPVSKIFIVVKAEDRIDSVIDSVRKYSDRFLDFPMECVAALVTHMDRVSWKTEEFLELINDEIGLDDIVYSSKESSSEQLLKDILSLCSKKFELTINDENFFKIFKIHNKHRKILKCTEDEVERFTEMKNAFNRMKKQYSYKDIVDLTFEFQAYMTEEIVQAQKRISEKNNFTFVGEDAVNEAGHVANMVIQLRIVLYDIRFEALKYQAKECRCPHCNLLWKIFGEWIERFEMCCSGIPEMGKFEFHWESNKETISKFQKNHAATTNKSSKNVGCWKSINWLEMDPVSLAIKVNVDDVKLLPVEAKGVVEMLKNKITTATNKLVLETSSK